MLPYCPYLLAVFLFVLTSCRPAMAQDGAGRVFPNGAQRGSTVTLTFPAMAEVESATLIVEGEGVKPLGPFVKGVGKVAVAPDAAVGRRQVRLVGPKTATTPRPFFVGTLPVLLDAEVADKKAINDRLAQAQRIEQLPLVLNGSLAKSGDIDVYQVALKKGDCLVIASESRLIAAPTNLGVYLRDLSGQTVPLVLDYRKRDPLYWGTVPADGEYQLQLFEITNNMGDVGEQTLYRVTVTTGPWLDYVIPSGAPRATTAHVTAYGWNLGGKIGPGSLPVDVPVPADASPAFSISAAGAPNGIPFGVGTGEEAVEAEPNNRPEQAQPIPLSITVNGAFSERRDLDCFRLALKAKEVLVVDVEARELESYADVILRVRDATGKELVSEDDLQNSRDPHIVWTAPADGDYVIELCDLAGNSRGGPSLFYRLHVAVAQPELRVIAREVTFPVKPSAKVEVPVTVYQTCLSGEITLRVEGLPAGVTAEPVPVKAIPNRSNQTQTKLVLTAAAEAKPGYALVRIVATSSGAIPLTAPATWALTGDGGWTYGTGSTDRLVVLIPTP
jgi:hypothetical protein